MVLLGVGAWPNAYHSWGEVEQGLLPALTRLAIECRREFPDVPLVWIDENAPHPLIGDIDSNNPGGDGSWALLRRTSNILRFNEAVRKALAGALTTAVPTWDVTLGRPGNKDFVHFNQATVMQAVWEVIFEATWEFFNFNHSNLTELPPSN